MTDAAASIPYEVLQACGFNELAAYILYKRGFKDGEVIRAFLNPNEYRPTDPFEFEDMNLVIKRIHNAIAGKERILVYGDYDVDGITSAAILCLTLKSMGADVAYHLPDRFSEGYGMSMDVIGNMPHQGIKLILTCDCGISNLKEIEYANSLGIKTIVSDHHTPPDVLPPALYVLNPKFFPEDHPARNIAGVGMAYFLSKALIGDAADDFLDLAVLGTIADSVPLNRENRYILQRGWDGLISGRRPGLAALFNIAHLKENITEEDIAFQIVPRLNSAGRMNTAVLSLKLLTEDNPRLCLGLAKTLNKLNSDRKKIQKQILEEAEEKIEKEKLYENGIIGLYSPQWHQGIIGIAAGRITEHYGLPCLLMAKSKDGRVIGSARSIEGVSMYDILSGCSDCLAGFGGHAMAAGFSLEEEQLDSFLQKLLTFGKDIQRTATGASVEPELELLPEQINRDTYHTVRGLAPFGEGFPTPVFMTRCMEVIEDQYRGFHRMIIGLDGKRLHALWWDGPKKEITPGYYDVTYTINMDKYRDVISITIADMAKVMSPARPMPVPVVTDLRDINIDEIAKQDGCIYYEGLADFGLQVFTRDTLPQCDRLIMLSTPPSPGVLRDVVFITNPKEVLLYFAAQNPPNPDMLKNLMGIIKYAQANDKTTDIRFLASQLGITEMATLQSLKYLESTGLVELEEINRQTYYVVIKGDRKREDLQLKNRLTSLFNEINSFKSWLRAADTEQIKDLLK